MSPGKSCLPLLIALLAFCAITASAHADSYGYYAVGTFQFDASSISGTAGGICQGQCSPWGDLAVLSLTFSSSVIGFQQTAACANGQCETEINGELGPGSVSAELSVGQFSQVYELDSGSLAGTFNSHFCTGPNCVTWRPETDLTLDFAGLWNNDWYSTGTVQLHCFENGGCSAGSGAGELDTYVPEPSALMLLGTGIASAACARRSKRNRCRSGRRHSH